MDIIFQRSTNIYNATYSTYIKGNMCYLYYRPLIIFVYRFHVFCGYIVHVVLFIHIYLHMWDSGSVISLRTFQLKSPHVFACGSVWSSQKESLLAAWHWKINTGWQLQFVFNEAASGKIKHQSRNKIQRDYNNVPWLKVLLWKTA